jgi:four helix bundle protein
VKSENVIREKSFAFAVRIVNMYRHLTERRREFVLSKQALRSGTSIGANVEEAIGGQSRADFISKLNIAYKEARETSYWIRLLQETNYLDQAEASSLLSDAEELLRIIGSILKTSKPTNS